MLMLFPGVVEVGVFVQVDPVSLGPVNVAGALKVLGGPLVVGVHLEVEHGRVDGLVGLRRPHPHAGVRADDGGLQLVLGLVEGQGDEEQLEHAVPEAGQQGVVDQIEYRDQGPRFGGPN